ncbi:MAG TPA: indole-3-glycerol-phosphate synthase [Leptospiraceae bacterium]|nr:indole-3-glycerol-phosphate synthase [Leptospiraceae bacterium]HNO23625.1 indole-3-glycerol-phosphate synthase [Leptospiraceae bacterium]
MSIPPILQKIVQEKYSEIAQIPEYSEFSRKTYSLKQSILGKKTAIIAECKKGSPSAGILKADYFSKKIALEYERFGAAGISVLTDRKFFYGSISDLEDVSSSVGIPVLRKDFIIDELQIREARYFGASAFLLIARILEKKKLRSLLEFGKKIGLECLVEIHTKEEAADALDSGAEIIGINSRDLDTFQINNSLIPEIAEYLPDYIVRVGESGVHGKEDLLKMGKRINAYLIGTYFMESENLSESFHALMN